MTGKSDSPNAVAGLSEAVAALRAELEEAQRQASNSDMRFRIGAVEMEFLVELERQHGGSGGLKVYVLEAGLSGSVSRGSTHRVLLTLHPFDSETGRDATISGRGRRGE
jgi:hypothetical protein